MTCHKNMSKYQCRAHGAFMCHSLGGGGGGGIFERIKKTEKIGQRLSPTQGALARMRVRRVILHTPN